MVPVDGLPEPADVVDHRRDPGAERLQERPRLVELVPVGEGGDGRSRECLLDRRLVEVAEAPLGLGAGGCAKVVERDPRIARDEQPGAVDPSDGRSPCPRAPCTGG